MVSHHKKEQAKDTGLAIILILLLFVYLGGQDYLILPAIIVLLLAMTWPMFFGPMSMLWFGMSRFLGGVMSKVLLALIFYALATPIGLLRKLAGADAMNLKQWRSGRTSVFLDRNHLFNREDVEKPY